MINRSINNFKLHLNQPLHPKPIFGVFLLFIYLSFSFNYTFIYSTQALFLFGIACSQDLDTFFEVGNNFIPNFCTLFPSLLAYFADQTQQFDEMISFLGKINPILPEIYLYQ